MAIAMTLQEYLRNEHIDYDVVRHTPTARSQDSANEAHIANAQMAKCVIFKDDQNYMMAVLPANRHVKLDYLDREFHSHFQLVQEYEFQDIFEDCKPGAIPPLGQAYYIDMVVDPSLLDQRDVYVEGGDHETLVHLSSEGFRKLIRNSRRCSLS